MSGDNNSTNWFRQTFHNAARAFGLMQDGTNGDRFIANASELDAQLKEFCGKDSAALTKMMRRKRGAKPPTTREVVEAACAVRWEFSINSFRSYLMPNRRRVSFKHAKFREDLLTFGRAEFGNDGKVRKNSLQRGPNFTEYQEDTPAGQN